MKKTFVTQPFDESLDKWIEIEGPDLSIRVDYDDVNHKAVRKNVKHMLEILNSMWDPQ